MSDHDLILLVVASSFAVQFAGLILLGLQLREARRDTKESQRLTRAVAGLVMQETAKLAARL